MRAHWADNRKTYAHDDWLTAEAKRTGTMQNDAAQALYPLWTEKVISGKGVEHFWRGEGPPTLLNPSPVWNKIYRMLVSRTRIPVPFTHFAWRPF